MYCGGVACMCVCVPCVCLVLRGARRGYQSLETGVHTVVNHPVEAGNQSLILWQNSQHS